MIFRKLCSPSWPILGLLVGLIGLVLSAFYSFSGLAADYVRWGDIINNIQDAFVWSGFLLSAIIAFNSSSLSAPHVQSATGIGKKPLWIQLGYIAVCSSAALVFLLTIGQLPLIIRALLEQSPVFEPALPSLITVFLFSLTTSTISTIIGFALSRLFPIIPALLSTLIYYATVAIGVNDNRLWLIVPLRASGDLDYTTFSLNNSLKNVAALCILALFALLLLTLITHVRNLTSPTLTSLSGALSVVVIVLIGASASLAAGPGSLVNNDVCQTGTSGVELCVTKADEPGLKRAMENIDALVSLIPGEEVQEKKLAEVHSFHLRNTILNSDNHWRNVEIRGKELRLDLTQFALSAAGIGQCTDPVAGETMAVERIAVYLLNKSGSYSHKFEDGGTTLYNAVNESDGSVSQVDDYLSQLSDEQVATLLRDNWQQIHSCQAPYSLVSKPKPAGDN